MKDTTRTIVYALVAGAIVLLVYYLAAVVRGPDVEYIGWNSTHALVLTVFGMAAGAAWGSRKALENWKTLEVILVANLGIVFGLLFLGWGLIWNLVEPLNLVFPGLQEIFYGFWFIAAILAAYIVRKPGAALAAEALAALAEFLAGGEWGLTLVIAGIIQGGMAEIVFAMTGYRKFNLMTLGLAGAAAGAGSLVVDYFFWYSGLTPDVLLIMLVARLISGFVLAGWLGKLIGDGLNRSGALGSFAIGYQE